MEEDQHQQHQQQVKSESESQDHTPNSPNQSTERSEPVRSRWTPKPEQILILESIFNSGMVNPPKDETVRIRKLLEKFGTVGDANVFYWFQNRRSRSRRRQRQMQAAALGGANVNNNMNSSANSSAAATSAMGFGGSTYLSALNSAHASFLAAGLPSSCGGVGGGQEGLSGFFSGGSTHQMGFPQIDHTSASASSVLYPSDAPNLSFQTGVGFGAGTNISGFITVFINGIATEVPRGPLDLKTVFGENVMLVHSSGGSVPTNEFGFLMQSLQHGESYYLVSKQPQV